MNIKKLKISSKNKIIRDIDFHSWVNLIVDLTENLGNETGNNVWKTTVLKLIDFCLWASADRIYKDSETKNDIPEVKNFLHDNEVIIELTIDSWYKTFAIERWFWKKSKYKINWDIVKASDIDMSLKEKLFWFSGIKPTFRQIIWHNIRYDDYKINNTLKLHPTTKDSEYEAIYLYLFWCPFDDSSEKQNLQDKLNKEIDFKKRLENEKTKAQYEVHLEVILSDIEDLSHQKNKINIDIDFEDRLNEFNALKYKIWEVKTNITKLEVRRKIIQDSKNKLQNEKANIDINELKLLYGQAKIFVPQLTKTFDDLLVYHNWMIDEKLKFITNELPSLEEKIKLLNNELNEYLVLERWLQDLINTDINYKNLESIITALNEKYFIKWELEAKINQINNTDMNIKNINEKLNTLWLHIYSEDFLRKVRDKIKKFNKYFWSISSKLYGEDEKYAVSIEKSEHKKTKQPFYKFESSNFNASSGKKQWEIISFDIAYILFAREEWIPHLNFILNDKKELMHENQLDKLVEILEKHNIQLVASILRGKISSNINIDGYKILELSQNDKLFKF